MAKKQKHTTVSAPSNRPSAPLPPRAGFRKDGRRLGRGGKVKK